MLGFPESAAQAAFNAAVVLAEGRRQHELATATTQAAADAAHAKYYQAIVAAARATGGVVRADAAEEALLQLSDGV